MARHFPLWGGYSWWEGGCGWHFAFSFEFRTVPHLFPAFRICSPTRGKWAAPRSPFNSDLPHHHSYPEIGCMKRHHSCHTTNSDHLIGAAHLQVMTDTETRYHRPSGAHTNWWWRRGECSSLHAHGKKMASFTAFVAHQSQKQEALVCYTWVSPVQVSKPLPAVPAPMGHRRRCHQNFPIVRLPKC